MSAVQDAHFDRILTARRNETKKKAYFAVPILSEPFKTEPEVDAAIDGQINSIGVDGWITTGITSLRQFSTLLLVAGRESESKGRVARTLSYAEGAPSSGFEGGSWI